jgi:Uma2 family endonuclease
MAKTLMLEEDLFQDLIRERKAKGLDLYDEVWGGTYVMPSMPSLSHQKLVHSLEVILDEVVVRAGNGEVYPGANVSDRRDDWKENFRVPDIVVVLRGGRAVACDAYLHGGPDFLVEIQTPGDATEEKIPFYCAIGVRELLIIARATRQLRLYRHDGHELRLVEPSDSRSKKWLASEVVPLAFRRKEQRGKPATEVRRTDRRAGSWTV